MKKSLVLAMAMALGVTASAYAANPFSDVPAGHWAYDSISKLAAAGVVEGYPDGSFKGDNLMTRYEMAQIVAKAMAKGANVDALAAEFADELDNLGVRVAALEKKVDNVKITGQIRYNYTHNASAADADGLRTRLWIAGQVNEDWKYTAMIQNTQTFKSDDNGEEGDVRFQRAWVDGKIGGLKVRAGRAGFTAYNAAAIMPFGSDLYDNRADYIQAQYGKKIQVTAIAGKLSSATGTIGSTISDAFNAADPVKSLMGNKYSKGNDFWAANIKAGLGKAATLNVGYYDLNKTMGWDADKGAEKVAFEDKEIINVGLQLNAGKSTKIVADWYKVNSDEAKIDGGDAWVAGIMYKGANAAKPGSFGLAAKYMNFDKGISVANGWNATQSADGAQGWAAGAYYTIAKNIVGGVEYYATKVQGKQDKDETLWSQLIFTF